MNSLLKIFNLGRVIGKDYACIELINSIYDFLNQNKYTSGVFIDLSNAFDTGDHKILIDQLNLFSIKNNSLSGF